MDYARIMSTGAYLPQRILTNAELEKLVDTSDAWITERTGIKQRHIAADDETAATMAYAAAQQALAAADLTAQAIDLIIVATSTPDRIFPSTACLVQERLGITNCPAFDISAACSGFIYALTVAEQFIRTGAAKTALIIGSEVMSRLVDWQDRKTCVLFGDGAGAVLLQASDKPGIISSYLSANGQYKDLLTMPSNLPGAIQDAGSPYLQMLGSEVFKHAVTTLGNLLEHVISSNHIDKSTINWLIPHQANLRIILAAAKKLDLPPERVVITVDQHGNTSAASIPIAFNQAIRDGRIQRGHKILLEAFGGGMTWGAVLLEF